MFSGAMSSTSTSPKPTIWWSNAFFFVATHLVALLGAYARPPSAVHRHSLLLAFSVWQASCFGITIGYHRLYSHRAFRAAFGVRLALAFLGSMAFQGSIKWWCLRHRLHHRFTDDPVHDPYSATRGLVYSHFGWIFYKAKYEKMDLIERDDLDRDPVVRFQHKHYVLLALSLGFGLPLGLGYLWGDPWGSIIWAGFVARLAIWHCTFIVNSFAHWDGLQPYSDENTSRGNLAMAMLTCGEGNHNFHAFPQDFRSGPSRMDWDPSKWIILLLHRVGLATGLRRAREEDIKSALAWMHHKVHAEIESSDNSSDEEDNRENWEGPFWNEDQLQEYIQEMPQRCIVLLDGYAVDATSYLADHPGGASLLRKYSYRIDPSEIYREQALMAAASNAFHGGMNQHSRAARQRVQELRVARLLISDRQ